MESLLTLDELVSATGGRAVVLSPSFAFTSVATDSRFALPLSLFVPLVGENQDGHKYVRQAIEKGASVVLAAKKSRPVWEPLLPPAASPLSSATVIEVDNTLHALQMAARSYIDKFPDLIKIGITGSNGKTTTKEMIAAVLRKKYNTAATQGNFNSETGVPLSVFSLLSPIPCPLAVFEMGMNREGEIAESAEVIRPEIAVITNIGTAHIGILGSRDAIAKEKKNIFNYIPSSGAAFIPYGDDYAAFLKEGVKGKIIEFGLGATEGLSLVKDRGLDGLDVMIGKAPCHLLLAGRHNLSNAASAIEVGRYMGVSDKDIASALEELKPLAGRGAVAEATLTSGATVRIVRDYYNANPQSMNSALDVCDATECGGKKIYVLGDMKESDSEPSHRALGKRLAKSKADIVIFVGEDIKWAYKEAESCRRCYYCPGSDIEAMKKVSSIVLQYISNGDIILFKASRSLALERAEAILTGKENN